MSAHPTGACAVSRHLKLLDISMAQKLHILTLNFSIKLHNLSAYVKEAGNTGLTTMDCFCSLLVSCRSGSANHKASVPSKAVQSMCAWIPILDLHISQSDAGHCKTKGGSYHMLFANMCSALGMRFAHAQRWHATFII